MSSAFRWFFCREIVFLFFHIFCRARVFFFFCFIEVAIPLALSYRPRTPHSGVFCGPLSHLKVFFLFFSILCTAQRSLSFSPLSQAVFLHAVRAFFFFVPLAQIRSRKAKYLPGLRDAPIGSVRPLPFFLCWGRLGLIPITNWFMRRP